MMKRRFRVCILSLALSFSVVTLHAGDKTVTAQEDSPDPWLTGDASVEFASRYIQAGGESAYGSPVFNYNVELEAFYFTLGVASHIAFQNPYKEVDFCLDYTRPLGPVNISLGYVYADIMHGTIGGLHDFYGGISLPFQNYYTLALNGEADVTHTVGTFTELLATAKYPVIKEKLVFSPYAGAGYSYGFNTGTTLTTAGAVGRFGINTPFTLTRNWELNFQAETVFSHQLNGQVWYGTRITYNF